MGWTDAGHGAAIEDPIVGQLRGELDAALPEETFSHRLAIRASGCRFYGRDAISDQRNANAR